MTVLTQGGRRSPLKTDEVAPILIVEWSLNNRGETARVSIENYKGTWLISLRKWFKIDDCQMRPGKGLAIGAKNLDHATTIAPLAGVGIEGGSA
jgi:hypothetical protein